MEEIQRKYIPVPLVFDFYKPENSLERNDDKAPIILTHGFFINRSLYRSIAKELCNKTGRAVYNVDLRNHGESPNPEDTGVMEMSEDIFALIQEKQLKKVVFISHSFSSRIATIVATTKQPTVEVEKMVLIDFAPYWSDEPWANAQMKADETYDNFLRKIPPETPVEIAEKLAIKYTFRSKVDMKLDHPDVRILVKKGNKFELFCDRKKIKEAVVKGKFGYKNKIIYHGPVLFVKEPASMFWDEDTIAQHMKYFPNNEFVTIPDTTHMLPFEKPEEFVAEVERFLKSDS